MSEELLQCYNKGCGKKFNPNDNKSDSCRYHPGPPYFHDAYKIWNCCNKKSTDFTTWLSFEGCTLGKHNPIKQGEGPPKVDVKQQEIVPKATEKVIVWNGLNKPAPREEVPRNMSKLKMEPTEALLNAIEKHNQVNCNDGSMVHVGVCCKNAGCEKKYEGKQSNEDECIHHSGIPVFHEGMKYWSCCQRKTSNFNSFLEQKGCVVGRHCWSKNERVDKIREDWFSRAGFIHLNIYCKGALPNECDIESDGFILRVKVVHGFGTKETPLNYELFGQIDVPESKVVIGERKLEVIMKQKDCAGWPRLTYDPAVDCDSKLSV